MEQVLIGGYNDNLHRFDTEYSTLFSGRRWTTEERIRESLISTDGKIKSLRVELSAPPGGYSYFIFTVRVNGIDTALSCTIKGTAVSGQDLSHEVVVSPGDEVCLQCTPSGWPTLSVAVWSTIFEGFLPGESICLCGIRTNDTCEWYWGIQTAGHAGTANPWASRQVCVASGKIKNMYARMDAPLEEGESVTLTFYRNNYPTPLACTISYPDETSSNTVDEVEVSAGDVVQWKASMLPGSYPWRSLAGGFTFLAGNDGESLILGATSDDLNPAATEFNRLGGYFAWNEAEVPLNLLAQRCTLKSLHIQLSGAPGVGSSYQFAVRRNGADTPLTCTISGDALKGSDLVNEVIINDWDKLTLKCTPVGSPAIAGAIGWGLVSFREPGPAPIATVIFAGIVSAQATAGERVTITVTAPDGSTIEFRAYTEEDLTYSRKYPFTEPGSYSAKARIQEDEFHKSAESLDVPFEIFSEEKLPRTVTLDVIIED